jgi:site-specific recombinase XerD
LSVLFYGVAARSATPSPESTRPEVRDRISVIYFAWQVNAVRLIFTDNTFTVAGVPAPGVPFLINVGGELVEAANRYLYYMSYISGRTTAETTRRTYADHLYDFFSFLEENDLAWDSVNHSYLAAWRNGMQERGLKRTTCNSRIRTVSAFYTWCRRTNLIDRLPFDHSEVRVKKPAGFLAHLDASGNRVDANELTLPSTRPVPKFLSLHDAATFMESLSPERTKLVGWLMVLAGLRRAEAARLDIRVLPNIGGQDPARLIKVTLDPAITPTKGSKERWVQIPYALAGRLHDYLMRERPKLAKMYKQRYGRATTRLFLTRTGEELSLDGLNEQFRQASRRSGIRCHPHMLRHTFAVHELVRMSGKPNTNALSWVSDRLGHASTTTTDIYVKAADIVTHDDADGYVAEMLQAMARGYADDRP